MSGKFDDERDQARFNLVELAHWLDSELGESPYTDLLHTILVNVSESKQPQHFLDYPTKRGRKKLSFKYKIEIYAQVRYARRTNPETGKPYNSGAGAFAKVAEHQNLSVEQIEKTYSEVKAEIKKRELLEKHPAN